MCGYNQKINKIVNCPVRGSRAQISGGRVCLLPEKGVQCVTLGEAMRDEVGFVCRVMESELYGKGRDYDDCMQYAQNAMDHGSPVTAQLFVNQANDAQAAIDGMVDGLV